MKYKIPKMLSQPMEVAGEILCLLKAHKLNVPRSHGGESFHLFGEFVRFHYSKSRSPSIKLFVFRETVLNVVELLSELNPQSISDTVGNSRSILRYKLQAVNSLKHSERFI